MKNRLNHLAFKLQKKGFTHIEIPYLVKDVFEILDQDRYCTLPEVNNNLEDLGWGIEIIDKVTYEGLVTNAKHA